MPLEIDATYLQRWYIEGGAADVSVPEPILCTADIERESDATLIHGHTTGSTTVQCLLFATCGLVMPIWTKTTSNEEADVLYLPYLFPNGYQSYRVTTFPIINSPMQHNWRIFVTQSPENAQINCAVSQKLGVNWRGNVVLAKYGDSTTDERDRLKDVLHGSAEFATVLLDAWFKQSYVSVQCEDYASLYINADSSPATDQESTSGVLAS